MDWLEAAQEPRHGGQPGVLVTVAEVRGHAPPEPGQDGGQPRSHLGSVGGGNLEASAVAGARELIHSGQANRSCARPGSARTPAPSTAVSAAAASPPAA